MYYLDLLNHSYEQTIECVDNDMSKLEYLAEDIFGFTTYENIVSSLFAVKALEVCKAISDRKTFDYIKVEQDNLWYLIMVNMPFFKDKLTWGMSIRGAFWELEINIHSCGIFVNYDQVLDMKLADDEWKCFIEAMAEFAKDEIEAIKQPKLAHH